jgi:isoaspartyl peptidase/L-asparaginase-like protein (Ntn-hydrolase superfamily)
VKSRCAIAIHGGAGTIRRTRSRPERAALERTLQAGYRILKDGGSSLEAVAAAVVILEDSGLFNAGRGAAPNADGKIELDAGIMDGATLRAGGVAAVRGIKNPIIAAREVMEHGKHVLLAAAGAERFARRHGLKLIPASYFRRNKESKHGTVGAVALDCAGNLAAATSTGGIASKLPGRVGDSPIVGAGVYADNATCAVSGTGDGELFLRSVLAFNVAARMRYRGESLARAGGAALTQVARLGGRGGLIAVDRRGRIAMPFNSEGMYRGCIDRRGRCMIFTINEHASA